MAAVSDGAPINPAPSTSKMSYANKVKRQYPKRNQAIVINGEENTLTKEYVRAIGNICGPANISHYSRQANNKIQVFLKSKEYLERVLENKENIYVENTKVEIRPLVTPTVRIIMSNVSPIIPDEILEESLINLELKPVSRMIELRAGFKDPEYAHVLSFRRQVYVLDKSNFVIPEYVIVNFEDINYKIYLSKDITCYNCKKEGHIAAKCPNKENNNTQTITKAKDTENTQTDQMTNTQTNPSNTELDTTTERVPENQSEDKIPDNTINIEELQLKTQTCSNNNEQKNNNTLQETNETIKINTLENIEKPSKETNETIKSNTPENVEKPSTQETNSKDVENEKINSKKRSAPDSLSSAGSTESLEELQVQTQQMDKERQPPVEPKKANKKKNSGKNRPRSLSPGVPTEEWVNPMRHIFREKKFNVTSYQFCNFIDKIQTASNPLALAKDFTEEPLELIHIMETLHSHTQNRAAKNRLTRTINKLQEQIDINKNKNGEDNSVEL